LYRTTDDTERGESLVEAEPAAFERIRAAYERFAALELKPVQPVDYSVGSVEKMPLPGGVNNMQQTE